MNEPKSTSDPLYIDTTFEKFINRKSASNAMDATPGPEEKVDVMVNYPITSKHMDKKNDPIVTFN